MQYPAKKFDLASCRGFGFDPKFHYIATAADAISAGTWHRPFKYGRKLMMPTLSRTAAQFALAIGFAVGFAAAAAAQSSAEPVERPVSYSSEQADRGKKKYIKECVDCHGENLKGGLSGGAPLRGLVFEEKFFDGLPASIIFAYMFSTMPPDSPGRYSPNTYANLMAYILKRNGFKAGAPLPSDFDALDYLIMEK